MWVPWNIGDGANIVDERCYGRAKQQVVNIGPPVIVFACAVVCGDDLHIDQC